MKRLSSHRSRPGWVSAEADLAQSIHALDRDAPGWDDDVRLLGLLRRLERDATPGGIQAAVDVYGEASLRAVLPCAGLSLSGDEVVGADGDVRFQFRETHHTDPETVSIEVTAAEASPMAAQVIHALMSGMTIMEVARALSLRTATVRRLHEAWLQSQREAAALLKREAAA